MGASDAGLSLFSKAQCDAISDRGAGTLSAAIDVGQPHEHQGPLELHMQHNMSPSQDHAALEDCEELSATQLRAFSQCDASASELDPRLRELLFARLVKGDREPLDFATEFAMSQEEFLRAAGDRALGAQLEQAIAINDRRARLLLAQFRANAALSLVRLATSENTEHPPEVARKACLDVLGSVGEAAPVAAERANIAAGAAPRSPGQAPSALRVPGEEALLRALQSIGELES